MWCGAMWCGAACMFAYGGDASCDVAAGGSHSWCPPLCCSCWCSLVSICAWQDCCHRQGGPVVVVVVMGGMYACVPKVRAAAGGCHAFEVTAEV